MSEILDERDLVSTPMAVREAAVATADRLLSRGYPEEICSAAELVLAEALNNIVEHAYGGRADGRISVAIRRCNLGLCLVLRDHGSAMPGLSPPTGRDPSVPPLLGNLPEGGFGWLLIRALASDVVYRRAPGCNHLMLRLDLRPTDMP